MSCRGKRSTFLLLELLVGLALLSLSLPLVFPNFSALFTAQREINKERALEGHVRALFLKQKAILSYEDIAPILEKKTKPIELERGSILVENQNYSYQMILSEREEKSTALLVTLSLLLESKKDRIQFSRNVCLKKS